MLRLSTIVIAFVVVAAGCEKGKKKDEARPPPTVSVAEARVQSMPVELDAVGTATSVASVSVAPRVGGQLVRAFFDEGSLVDEGAVLFEIDPKPYRAALSQAEAVLERDRATLETTAADAERWRALLQQKLVAPTEADAKIGAAKQAKGMVGADRAAIETTKLELEWTKVRSPIAGRVDRRLVDPGNLVAAGTPVVVVRQMSPMEVSFTLPQDKLADVAARMRRGPVPALAIVGNVRREGVLSFLGGAVDPQTGTVLCKARFENVDDALWPGSFVRVRVHVGEIARAVVVPKAAVQSGPSGAFVFVVKPDDTAEMRNVALGPETDGVVALEKGVSAGERVVTDGQLAVVPGAKVAVASANAASGTGSSTTNDGAGRAPAQSGSANVDSRRGATGEPVNGGAAPATGDTTPAPDAGASSTSPQRSDQDRVPTNPPPPSTQDLAPTSPPPPAPDDGAATNPPPPSQDDGAPTNPPPRSPQDRAPPNPPPRSDSAP